MSNAIVSNVYRYVIDDVINQVRGEFEDMGIDEAVLQELQRSWESKVARSRVANFGFSDEHYYDEDGEEHGVGLNNTSTEAMGAPIQYPSPYASNAAASLATLAANAGLRQHLNSDGNGAAMRPPQPSSQPQDYSRVLPDLKPIQLPPTSNGQFQAVNTAPQQQQHQQQQQQQQQQQKPAADIQLPGGGRPNIPQNDGAADHEPTTEEIDAHIENVCREASSFSFTATSSSGEAIPISSLPPSVKQLVRDAKERAVKAGALSSNIRIPQIDGEGDGDDDDINSDLDDPDDADDDADNGEEIEHIILCLYDKVSRTKNKWKCVLKDGIMLINGRDYLFHRASGDFEW